MPQIEISERAMMAINNTATEMDFHNVSEAIINVFLMERQQDAWIKKLKERLGETVWKKGIGELPLHKERTEEPKIVQMQALYRETFGGNHEHSNWGADCPVCNQYIHEDIDTLPTPEDERPQICPYCEQKLILTYPWETMDKAQELAKKIKGEGS